jgi:DNA-binding LytR/AlgR family response regulator
MNVLIIEDETRAANHLERLIGCIAPELRVIAKIETVREAVLFIKANPTLSLIFSDVQLADGLSFEIFEQVKITCPIIFTTAYDQYAIEAFKTNGIDYLLKPVEEERMLQAILKAKQFSPTIQIESLLNLSKASQQHSRKSRFMVKVGDKIKTIPITEILAFYSLEKGTYLFTLGKRSYPIDYALDELMDLLDTEHFFKINRKYIVCIAACSSMVAYSNSRLKLTIDGLDDELIVVAREKVQEFKAWLDR